MTEPPKPIHPMYPSLLSPQMHQPAFENVKDRPTIFFLTGDACAASTPSCESNLIPSGEIPPAAMVAATFANARADAWPFALGISHFRVSAELKSSQIELISLPSSVSAPD
eukprot:scaffold112691_cov28-Tisochrysis_lutea.AAC.1